MKTYLFVLRGFLIAGLLVLFTQAGYGNPGLVFNKLTTRDGLSHSTVYAITQDTKGFIWIGTREGLNRYDSYSIKTYYADPSDTAGLNSNQITALHTSPDGTLYIGTSKGLNVYDPDKDFIRAIPCQEEEIGLVRQLFEASDQRLYVCSDKGLFVLGREQQLIQLTHGAAVAINEYKKNVFWLATHQSIMLINQYGERIKEYKFLKKASQSISTAYNTSCIFRDSEGATWVGTVRNGVYQYIPGKDIFKPIVPNHKDNPIEVNVARSISEDNEGNLWIGTESGLFIYDKNTRHFAHYTQDFDDASHALNDKAIYSIYKGREGIMWIGTYFGGVNFVSSREKGFYKLVPDGGEKALSGKAVSQIIEDKKGHLWIGTEDGGISVLDRKAGSFRYFKHINQKNSLSIDNVHAIHHDGRGNIWIGTFLGGLNKYDEARQEFSVYKRNENDTTSLSNNYVYAILKDSRNTLWIGTQNGLNIYDYKKDNFRHFKPRYFSDKFIYDILEDEDGNLWFCTRNSGIYFYHVREDRIVWYNKNNPDNHGLSNNMIISAYQDSKQRIWFGSLNGGLIRWDEGDKRFYAVTKQDGLPNNNVYGILEDGEGNLWVSTNKGLSRFNPKDREFSNYNISHGLVENQFNFKSAYKDRQGWMYFGTVNGLCYFHPDSLTVNTVPPAVHFTDLQLFNKTIEVGDRSVLTSHIDETSAIELKYSQNVITFEFSAINYFSPGNNTFSYYMEGFEDGWSNMGHKTSATYTNLSPGEYTFHIKAANNNGVWSGERQINLTVLPPFWLSGWALGFYGLLAVGMGLLYRRYVNYRQREKLALHLERVEKNKMRELNQHKLNFFTYISHEFKTPLTLIIASIDRFLNKGTDLKADSQEIHLIRRNATRLHFLIDQLMEFRKIETDHTSLELRNGDIILFLKDTFSAFIPLFSKKNIAYQVKVSHEEYATAFDSDKLEKIIANLLSNAVKNTREFGEIVMEADILSDKNGHNFLRVILTDSGIGLFEGEAEKIFMPFYQSGTEHNKTRGSGIGLTLVKSLIDYLKGNIKIESTTEKGTVITFELPLYNERGHSLHLKAIKGNKGLSINHDLFSEEEMVDPETGEEGNPELMVVEDNRELLNFVVNHFSRYYKISYAPDGKSAWEKIQKRIPDVIVSDVIMPEMDGVTLCEKIKSNINTSHIPVILLTARAAIQNKIEGLDVGADAYLPKPFNLKELELMVKNMLASRNNLKKHFLKFGNLDGYEKPLNNKDQFFIQKLTEIVHDHLDDPEFNITVFTREAGISRTLLHIKLKKLVNLSTSEFVKTIRLQKAADLLKSGFPVAEVAFQVGFRDPNYFSRAFKEKYNSTPTDFRVIV